MAQKKFIIDGGFSTNADSVITGNLVMTGNVLPSINSDGVTGYDLGSPDFKWRDLFLSQGSLYIDGQKVLQSDSGTIVVSADPDQSLLTKTTGTGVLTFQSETPISIAGTLQMGVGKRITSADGLSVVFGDKIDMDSNQIINVGVPTAEGHVTTKGYVDSAITSILGGGGSAVSGTTGTFSSDVSIQGNLTVSGTTTTVNSETISLADNIIDLNSNMTSGTPTENAGIRIMRGDESAVQLRWNEATDRWTFTNDGITYYPLAISTTDLAEGDNLYFTDARAQAALSSTVSLLQTNITSEATARAAADTSIRTDFGAADATLQSNIDSEEAARIAGDSATLASAQAYADSAEADAIASANAYTDGREAAITSAYQTAIAAAAAAQDELNELVDVNISAVSNGQFLRYDLGAQKWVNVTASTTMIAEGTKLYFTDARAQAAVAADIASAVAAEASDRSTADANLQSQIDFITSNVDPAALDSLTEIVAAFQTADGDLLTTVNSNTSAINAEVTRATGAETTLQSNIDTVAGDLAAEVTRATGAESDLQDAIDVVSAGLATEASTRSSADTTLQGNIDTLSASLASEVATRAVTDESIQANITAEEAARIAADSALESSLQAYADQAEVDAKAYTDTRETAITTAYQSYADSAEADAVSTANAYTDSRETAITTAYTSAIATSKAASDAYADQAEADAKAYTDTRETAITTAYQTYADAAEADAKTYADQAEADAKTYADGIVSTEATARANADTALQSNIDVEKGRIDAILLAADADKDTFAEIVTFINAVDTTNDTALGTEITTRAAADTALQANIDAEATARANADTALQGNIDAEAATRAAADTALDGRVTVNEGDIAALEADLAALTTDDVAEGSNLYFTDARAVSAVETATLSSVTTSGNVTVGAGGSIILTGDPDTNSTIIQNNGIDFIIDAQAGGNPADIRFQVATANSADALKIRNDGSLLANTNSGTIYDDSNSEGITDNAYVFTPTSSRAMQVRSYNGEALALNRMGSTPHGDMVTLYKDGTKLASMGTESTNNFYFDNELGNDVKFKVGSVSKFIVQSAEVDLYVPLFFASSAGNSFMTVEGSTNDTNEVIFAITDPTADRTITFPDETGTVALTSQLSTLETSLQTYADSAEADAITSANAYTDGREVAITAAYEAYADSVVATEASARAAGDTSTLNSAQSYTDTAISNLVNGASAAYDTLKEIQDAMATDAELSAAISAITIGNGTQTISAGSYLTGGGSFTANQTSNSSVSLAVDATSANTASKVVARDASGNFSAGTITAALSGNASTASKWASARTITLGGDLTGNVSIDGSANVTLTATIAANSVALGTDTTGAYVQDVVAGSGISISESASGGEGNVATISHADTSSVANVSSNNSGGVFIQDVALTFDTYGHTTGASVATATMTNFHSGVTDITSTVATNNASGSVNIAFAELVGAVHYNVYLNRILLRSSEVTNVNTTTGEVTIATGVLATDDELEVTGLKIV